MGLDPALVHYLHCVQLARLTTLAPVNLPEPPPAESAKEDEIVFVDRLLGGREGEREGGREGGRGEYC